MFRNVKIQRPGHTESWLLWQSHLRKRGSGQYQNEKEIIFMKWLYKTSGFYDTCIEREDVNVENEKYNNFLDQYKSCVNNSFHIDFNIGSPAFRDPPDQSFINYVNSNYEAKSICINNLFQKNETRVKLNRYWCKANFKKNKGVFHDFYRLLDGKKVLIISPFCDLIKKQYENNIFKIFPNFSKLQSIQTIRAEYTFLNRGPDRDFFETLSRYKQKIDSIDFDILLPSCGVYAAFLCDYAWKKGKTGMYFGHSLHKMFGISLNSKEELNKNWITKIPKDLIPEYYKEIERGSYWGRES